jgi:hypothetical protein
MTQVCAFNLVDLCQEVLRAANERLHEQQLQRGGGAAEGHGSAATSLGTSGDQVRICRALGRALRTRTRLESRIAGRCYRLWQPWGTCTNS